MNSFAIFGSGFGLYGYLPALVSCGQHIVLPQRYLTRFSARSELAQFTSHIDWHADESAALKKATGVVLALQPNQQQDWLPHCLTQTNIKYLLLEKPLAQSPERAAIMFDDLINSGKVFRIGYTFRYTIWGKKLIETLKCSNNINKISIHWNFLAHHFRHNVKTWKRFHGAGGGAIRFYGIHIIALLAEIGYRDVTSSLTTQTFADEHNKWQAVFTGEGLPECEITIDSKSSTNQFQIFQHSYTSNEQKMTSFANLRDPFDSEEPHSQPDSLDQRVPILNQLCQSLWNLNTNMYDWYARAIQLWLAVEEKMIFVPTDELECHYL